MIEVDDLTVLTGWAEAVAEALAYTPARAQAVVADARPGASWRLDLGVAEPSPRLSDAIDSLERALSAAMPPGGAPSLDAVLLAVEDGRPGESALDALARRVLRSTVEQLCTRRAEAGGFALTSSLGVVLTRPAHRPTRGSASRSAARVLIPSLGKIRYRWPLTVRCER